MNKKILKLHLSKIFIIISLILLGLFFRTFQTHQSSLWTDEFATNWVASAPSVNEVIHRAALTQGQSPFYFVLLHFILKELWGSEFSLRFLSLLASLISIYIIFEIGLLFFNRDCLCFSCSRFLKNSITSGDSRLSSKALIPSIFVSLIFIVDPLRIYYAQEARPYALATMFALLSVYFFFKMFGNRSVLNVIFYILTSALVCYSHYVFGTVLLLENLWFFLLVIISLFNNNDIDYKKKKVRILLRWIFIQLGIIVFLIPLLFHMVPIIKNSSKWTWLSSGGFFDVFSVLFKMFDTRTLIIFSAIYVLLFLYDFASKFQKIKINTAIFKSFFPFIFLVLWFLLPPLFAYFVGKFLHTSMLDIRYMTLSGIAFYFFAGLCLSFIDNKFVKIFLISFIISAYIGITLFPLYQKHHRFSNRICHDWRGALEMINFAIQPGDCIIIRSGFVKENWVATSNNTTIVDYVQAPLKSFYFRPRFFPEGVLINDASEFFDVYNMTYTREYEFYPYYDKILAGSAAHERIWVIGVNPPNTNYKISQVPDLLRDSHKKILEKNFSGVYLALIKRRR